MNLERVDFRFSDGTTVTFRHSSERWISWRAEVMTRQHRREKSVCGEFFHDEFLKPTLMCAERLVRLADERARQARVLATTAQ